jgi:nucleoid DNA-binding protein
MTQTQMTIYLADKIGITKRQAKSTLDELNELVTRQLKKEGSLRLAGLGVFRKPRPRRVWAATRLLATRSRFRRGPVYVSRRPRP